MSADVVEPITYWAILLPISVVGIIGNVIVIHLWSRERYKFNRLILMVIAGWQTAFMCLYHIWRNLEVYTTDLSTYVSLLTFSVRLYVVLLYVFLVGMQLLWIASFKRHYRAVAAMFAKRPVAVGFIFLFALCLLIRLLPWAVKRQLTKETRNIMSNAIHFMSLVLPQLLQIGFIVGLALKLKSLRLITTARFAEVTDSGSHSLLLEPHDSKMGVMDSFMSLTRAIGSGPKGSARETKGSSSDATERGGHSSKFMSTSSEAAERGGHSSKFLSTSSDVTERGGHSSKFMSISSEATEGAGQSSKVTASASSDAAATDRFKSGMSIKVLARRRQLRRTILQLSVDAESGHFSAASSGSQGSVSSAHLHRRLQRTIDLEIRTSKLIMLICITPSVIFAVGFSVGIYFRVKAQEYRSIHFAVIDMLQMINASYFLFVLIAVLPFFRKRFLAKLPCYSPGPKSPETEKQRKEKQDKKHGAPLKSPTGDSSPPSASDMAVSDPAGERRGRGDGKGSRVSPMRSLRRSRK